MLSGRALHLVKTLLTERERTILEHRYGLFGRQALPQREVAVKLGISRSYVSRIEKGALAKLYEVMKDER